MQYSGKPSVGRGESIVRDEETTAIVPVRVDTGEIEAQLDAAHKYPRSLAAFRAEAKEMACMDPAVAESCIYSVQRGEGMISGPSVRLAEICASAYGNLHVAARIKETGQTTITVEAAVWDLEKNNRVLQEVRRRITYKTGGRYNEDMIMMTANAAMSIAIRNAIFRVVPLAYVKDVYNAARKAALGTQETIRDRRAKLMTRLARLGVQEARVLARVNKNDVESVTLEDMELLIGLGTAIRDGDMDIDTAFPEVSGQVRPAAAAPAAAAPAAAAPAAAAPAAAAPAAAAPAAAAPEPPVDGKSRNRPRGRPRAVKPEEEGKGPSIPTDDPRQMGIEDAFTQARVGIPNFRVTDDGEVIEGEEEEELVEE